MDEDTNKLFYTCSLIEYIGRETQNRRIDIIESLGKANVERIYTYADVFHSDRIESVSAAWQERCNIREGSFDNISVCRYRLPSHWDIGKVYSRLINAIGGRATDTLHEVYASWLAPKIDDYNIAVYYMSPEYLYASYKEGCLLEY